MKRVVGVRFKKAGKIYYFDPDTVELVQGEHVIVETVRGIEYGEVIITERMIKEEDLVSPLKKVIRLASDEDVQKEASNREKETKAYQVCNEKIITHQLPMKLIDVEYTFDGSKIIFYFTAEGRIDFRELVKDLASVFRTRIELRQIGVRDEAKMLGGIGCCGRPLCCYTFLGDFAPVSIKMAKEQSLSLNPTKISGICSRLMCCLKYENDVYIQLKREAPIIGSIFVTEVGEAKVISFNVPKNSVIVQKVAEDAAYFELPVQEVQKMKCVFNPKSKQQDVVEEDLSIEEEDFLPSDFIE